jgi:hypothetical protein
MRKQIFLGLLAGVAVLLCTVAGLCAFQEAGAPANPPQARPGPSSGQPQAQPGQQPGREVGERAFGSIVSVGVDRLEIKRMNGTSQTVMVDDQTRYVEGGREEQKKLALEDLKPGDHVFVQGKTKESKEFVASVVRRITDQEMQRFSGARTGGEIVSIDGSQIKVRNPRQGEKTVAVNDQTAFVKDGQPITLKDLKVGDRIFVLGQENNGQFVATRVMTGQFRRGGDGARQPPPDNH